MDIDTGRLQERLTAELQQVAVATSGGGASNGAGGPAPVIPTDSPEFAQLLVAEPIKQKVLTKLMHERMVTRGRKVEAALARMETGTYGLCCQCEAEIDARLLDDDPAAVFCASCTAEREAR